MGRFGQRLFRHARGWDERSGLAIAERDRAGLVEQEHVDIASRFDGAPAHREHVLLHKAVDARNTDGAEQTANGRRE